MLSRPSVIMERLWGMFSNADEVQGDSEPPQSANSCSACINLLIHLGKLGIWGTPVIVHSNTTKALFSSPVCFFPLMPFDVGSLFFCGGWGRLLFCLFSVFSLGAFLSTPFLHYSFSPWLFFSFHTTYPNCCMSHKIPPIRIELLRHMFFLYMLS